MLRHTPSFLDMKFPMWSRSLHPLFALLARGLGILESSICHSLFVSPLRPKPFFYFLPAFQLGAPFLTFKMERWLNGTVAQWLNAVPSDSQVRFSGSFLWVETQFVDGYHPYSQNSGCMTWPDSTSSSQNKIIETRGQRHSNTDF